MNTRKEWVCVSRKYQVWKQLTGYMEERCWSMFQNAYIGIMHRRLDFCHMISKTKDEVIAKSERMKMKREVII